MSVKLPEDATPYQREIYNKNWELYRLAIKNRNRYGVLMSMCADLGCQDYLDENKFINVYPYSNLWYSLAYGTNLIIKFPTFLQAR